MKRQKRQRKPYRGALNARLPQDLAREYRVWVAANQDAYTYWDRKPGLEQFAGAVLLDFIRHTTPQEQAEILARSLPELEALEAADNAKPEPAPDPSAGGGKPVKGVKAHHTIGRAVPIEEIDRRPARGTDRKKKSTQPHGTEVIPVV